MCAVSMIGDTYRDIWTDPNYPWGPVSPGLPLPSPSIPSTPSIPSMPFTFTRTVTPEEFDALKREVEHMKKLLIAAKIYDEQTGQPDCEMDEKVEFLKKVAELMGVSLEEVFGK